MGSTLSGVGVLDKSVSILEAIERRPLALNDLVSATGTSRATAHRLAVALEQHGLIRRDDDGRFCLGVRLVALGRAAASAIPLTEAAGPALESLRDQTAESVQLYVRDGERRVCIAALESPHGLRTIVPMGASLPLDKGSAGEVLTPGRPEPRKGWTESVGEREAGVASVSAPVHDSTGAIVAAVSVSGPLERTTRHPGRKYAQAVLAAARQIEASL